MTQEPKHQDFKNPAKDDTNPFGHAAYRQKNKLLRWALVLAMATIAVLGLILLYRSFFSERGPDVPRTNATKKPNLPRPSPLLKDCLAIQQRINEITSGETVARQEKKMLRELLGQLQEKSSIAANDWDLHGLTDGQMNILRQKARSGDAVASAFLAQLDKYIVLKKRIDRLEIPLGIPRLVGSGDTHFQIAYDFLTALSGKNDAEIRRILQKAPLQEPLLPGFKIWNFWLEDEFCTFVTQGTAALTPEESTLQKNEIEQARLNSVFYIIGSYHNLQERKILKGGFLKSIRLGEIAPGQFRLAIDLRSQQHILVSAAALQMKKISRLEIFPRRFNFAKDYEIRFGPKGRWAQITILKKEIFLGRYIVIAVE